MLSRSFFFPPVCALVGGSCDLESSPDFVVVAAAVAVACSEASFVEAAVAAAAARVLFLAAWR